MVSRSGNSSVAILAMRAELAGFQLDGSRVPPSEESLAARGNAAHPEYRWLRLEGGVAAPDAWLDDQQATDRCAAVALRRGCRANQERGEEARFAATDLPRRLLASR